MSIAAEFRAFWVDAWGTGAMNQTEVNTLLGTVGTSQGGQLRDANCNAIVIQVRRNCDANYPSLMGEPYMSGLTPSNFNALQAVINAAHDTTGGKKRIEVHAWIVSFRTSGGLVYTQHNSTPTASLTDYDNYWISRKDTGAEVDDKSMDAGHPLVSEYTANVAMDIVTRFDVDAIHYDYIRTAASADGYNPTSVARYNDLKGKTGTPAASNTEWQQWRRDQITAVVRKIYAKIQAVKPSVKQTASVVTWNPSPTASTRAAFEGTRPYYDVYSDWDSWLEEGIVDAVMPMTYYNNASLPTDYKKWMNYQKDRHHNRHMYVGPGIYLNSLDNSLLQLKLTRDPSPAGNYAQGYCGYSYRVPYISGTWANQFGTRLKNEVNPTWDDIPVMTWKSSPTKGHISGTITDFATGKWIDGAKVTLSGAASRTQDCDGTGFYSFIDLSPGVYTVTVQKSGTPARPKSYPTVSKTVTVAIGAVTGNMYVTNFQLGGDVAPQISNVNATNVTNAAATITWDTDPAGTTQVEYGKTTSYGSSTTLNSSLVSSHSQTITGLDPKTLYHYRVKSNNSNGNSVSGDYTFTTSGSPAISGVATSSVGATSATIIWATDVPADSKVNYGLTTGYGSQKSDAAQKMTHSITLTGLAENTTYNYQCVSTNPYGTATSSNFTFKTQSAPTEIIVDNVDATFSGTWNTGAGGYDGNYRYIYNGKSTATSSATFTPNLAAGRYDVYVYYPSHASATTKAPFTIYHKDGATTASVNQTTNTGTWVKIGSDLRFDAGTGGYVTLGIYTGETSKTKYVLADAVKFVYMGELGPADLIVNNGDVGTSSTGTWNPGTYGGGYNNDYAFADCAATVTATYKWTPTVPQTALYDVYCWYNTGTNRATDANYTIRHANGTQSVQVNQQTNGAQWVLLSSGLKFNAGTDGYVMLDNKASNNVVIADAIRWVYAGPAPVIDNTPPTISISSPSVTMTKSGPVVYTVNYADDTGVSAITLTSANITLHKTGTANGTVTVSGTGTASRTVTISNITGDGLMSISIAAGTASDAAGNLAPAAGPASSVYVDNTKPEISIDSPSVEMTTSGPVTYTVTYDDASSVTLTSSDITLNKTGTANGTVAVSGSGNSSRTVTISNITGDGTLGISVAAGTAGDNAGNLADAAGPSATFVVDNTAPSVGSVTDEVYTISKTKLNAWWSAADSGSGVAYSEYAVGTTPGATNIKGWTNAGTANSAEITGLALQVNGVYYVSVRAVDNVGLTSAATSSAGVRVAQQVDSIPAAKALVDGSVILLPARVVTAAFDGRFYIEEDNRATGIRVQSADSTAVGQSVSVYGIMGVVDGERAITNGKIDQSAAGTALAPLFVVGKSVGSAGSAELYNIGLLLRTAGRVTGKGVGWFIVNDGSGADVKVYSGKAVNTGAFVGATGISILEGDQRVIRTRFESDVRIYAP